jgi:hypothetical protein
LFSVTAQNFNILIGHLSQLFGVTASRGVRQSEPLSEPSMETCRQADGFYFINLLKSSVMLLEFTNEGFEASVQKCSEIRSMTPNFEGTMAVLSVYVVGEEALAVSGTTSKVMKLLPPGVDDSDQEDDFPEQSAEEPISVPPHFWALSVPSTSNIRMIETRHIQTVAVSSSTTDTFGWSASTQSISDLVNFAFINYYGDTRSNRQFGPESLSLMGSAQWPSSPGRGNLQIIQPGVDARQGSGIREYSAAIRWK